MATGLFEIIEAETTTNLITNPSFESSTTGWTGGTISVQAGGAFQHKGAKSLKSDLSIVGAQTGSIVASYAISGLTASTSYYFSLWVYVPSTATTATDVYLASNIASATVTSIKAWSSTDDNFAQWTLLEATVVTAGTTSGDLQIKIDNSDSLADDVYIDAVQFEQKTHRTTYCDGDQDGCYWNGTPHASTSTREDWSKDGGRIWNLRDDKSYSNDQMMGAGLHPVTNILQPLAQGGNVLRRIVPQSRVWIFRRVFTGQH